nr:uncharacterized protein LOC109748705 [Aegilops tauschii subsp. strangulata]
MSKNRFPETALHFVNASGKGRPLMHPSFAFLPSRRRLRLCDRCNGLLLCRLYDASTRGCRYVVCNPATEQWVVLPEHGQSIPSQPLAGFFYNNTSKNRFPESALHFANASGEGRPLIHPFFAFLPSRRRLRLWDCCNGLLLCRLYDTGGKFRYVVCNPATEQWVVLPDPDPGQEGKVGTARLGFDPAVSSHFHVFVLMVDADRHITGADVYSSESGGWIHKDKGWDNNVSLADPLSPTVFLNGYLHFRTICDQWRVAAVDTKGESWSSFDTPCGIFSDYSNLGLIQQSQGRLYYVSLNNEYWDGAYIQLEVYALKGYTNKKWTLKHRAQGLDEFGGVTQDYFEWTAIDPECNSIFLIDGSDKTLKRYDMDCQDVTELATLGEGHTPYLPYVPFYSELESLCK